MTTINRLLDDPWFYGFPKSGNRHDAKSLIQILGIADLRDMFTRETISQIIPNNTLVINIWVGESSVINHSFHSIDTNTRKEAIRRIQSDCQLFFNKDYVDYVYLGNPGGTVGKKMINLIEDKSNGIDLINLFNSEYIMSPEMIETVISEKLSLSKNDNKNTDTIIFLK